MMDPKTASAPCSRALGEGASFDDIRSATFSQGNRFSIGEVVLLSRTRGGFLYGKVNKVIKQKTCLLDPTVLHPAILWQISYPNFTNREMCKRLPSEQLGKLPENAKLTHASQTQKRELGAVAMFRDLCNVVMCHDNMFDDGEMVLVPRSSGGFTYGEIVSKIKVTCSIDKQTKHQVDGFKIIIDANKTMKKELATPSIGKIPLIGIQQEPVKKVSENSKNGRPKLPRDNQINKEFSKRAEQLDDHPPLQVETTSEFKLPTPSPAPEKQPVFIDEDLGEEILWQPDCDDNSGSSSSEEAQPSAEPQKHGNLITLPNGVSTAPVRQAPRQTRKCLVVIDAPNVALKHGNGQFSTKGLVSCIDYWQARGHEVIAFLPEHFVSSKPAIPGTPVTLANYLNPKTKVDNVPVVNRLAKEHIVVITPPQDYDDSYCIQYAKQNNGIIVTNDLYRDHVDKQDAKNKHRVGRWVRQHCVSFTFVKDQFFPNPDFKMPTFK